MNMTTVNSGLRFMIMHKCQRLNVSVMHQKQTVNNIRSIFLILCHQ